MFKRALRILLAAFLAAFSLISVSYGSATPSDSPQLPGSISGRIQTASHTPVPAATVAALRLEYYGEQKRYSLVESVTTRADGTYVLRRLRPGKYFVIALPPDQQPVSDDNAETPPRALQATFYPVANSADESIPVVVASGSDTGAIEVTMSDAAVYSLCGKAQGLPDALPESLTLNLIRLGPEPVIFPPTIAHLVSKRGSPNHFCFQNVPAGDYSLNLQSARFTGNTEISVSTHDLTDLRLPAGPTSHIEGKVHVEGSLNHQDVYNSMAAPLALYDTNQTLVALQPNPNADLLPVRSQPLDQSRVAAVQGLPGDVDMRILLEPLASFQNGLPPLAAQVQDGGHFALTAVPSGRYRLSAEDMPVGFFLKSVRYAGKDVTSSDIEILSGSSGQLDISLSGDAVFIRGMVVDGKGNPISGAVVSLLPADLAAKTTTARPDGQFAFWNLAPGTYFLWAWQDLESPGLATRPSFLRAFPERAVRIEAVNPADPGYVVRVNPVPRDEVSRGGWQ